MERKKLINFISLLVVSLAIGIYAISNHNKNTDNQFYIEKSNEVEEKVEETNQENSDNNSSNNEINKNNSNDSTNKNNKDNNENNFEISELEKEKLAEKEKQDKEASYSEKDLEETKEIGLKFVPLVHSYDLDNGHAKDIEEATKYATEGMKGTLIGVFVKSKQPILAENFFAREVYDIKAIESHIDGRALCWDFEVRSKILNRKKELIKEEINRVTLLYTKVNGEWRVANYATTQYR